MASVPSITSTAEIIITDSNVATVSLEETLYRVTEAGGSVQVCVRVGSPSSGCPIASAFVVSLYTNDDDADSVTDYSAVLATLSFQPCFTLQCVTIAITDDSIPEPDESFSLILERSPGLDSRITLASSTGSVLILNDDDFLCTASGVPEVTVIVCTGNQPGSSLQCSFNGGQLHSCNAPMVLTRIVSPPGNQSVRIVSSTGEESTVSYSITTADPVTAFLPPLEIILNGGSPLVTESSVEAVFVTTRPVTGVRCFLRYDNKNDYKDCSSGRVSFTDLSPGEYVLKIYAYNQQSDSATAKIVVTI
ncbi:hypothetical protein GBAR_LOCUS11921 [Geodia barretti]|uniref:Calx-beta domain-containing protein n=1 Tax=Geodia barretti TaxID=519541 RepID=A0AA35WJY9_GEOBA|nr:hypothetical protein GBAR_LOCUS11921 [Geodia barretti]